MAEKTILDHIGIAVDAIAESSRFYEALGLEVGSVEEVPEQEVRVAFLTVGDSRLELLEATESSSAIARHLDRRGPGLHHICLRVPDIRATMKDLEEQGYRLLTREPQRGAHDCLVCFVHPKSAGGVLIELSEAVASDKS